MTEHYTEPIPASAPIRQRYVNGLQAAVSALKRAAEEERTAVCSPEAMAQNREALREEYAHLLGIDRLETVFGRGLPVCEKTLIGEDTLCTFYRMIFTLYENVVFTGIFAEPKKREEKAPLVIFSHGGGGSPELVLDMVGPNNYGNMARRLCGEGCCLFAPQLLLWNFGTAQSGGNIPSFDTPYDRRGTDNALKQFGVSIAGFEIFGISRALDYFCIQPGIDGNRIGMTGCSYGGFYTLYTMAYDTRIKAGWPAAFFNDRTKYNWSDFVWMGSARRFLDCEIAGLCAPRALWIDVGIEDPVFDNSRVSELFPAVKAFYRAADAEDRVVTNLWQGGHRLSDGEGKDNGGTRFFLAAISK